jgi:type I restriction enzyme R subunit
MTFKNEAAFEQAFIETLFNKGWESTVLKNPTEQDLIKNWAKILFENNSGIDRLKQKQHLNRPLSKLYLTRVGKVLF